MLIITPTLHAVFLAFATIASMAFAGIILARNPVSRPARMHAIYGGVAAWWFLCMSMIASASSTEEIQIWARLVHLSLGGLPAVMFHLNVVTMGRRHEYHSAIKIHYTVAALVTVFCLTWPALFKAPNYFSWGPYPAYTAWGLVTVGFMAFVFVEVINLYRKTLKHTMDPILRQKLSAFYHGNTFAAVAMVDFFCAFGFGVYPFAFVIMTLLNIGTVFGTIRYRLIEITPEIASAQILDALPEGVLVLDSQGIIRLANQAAGHMLGYPNKDLAGQSFLDVAPEPLRQLLTSPDADAEDPEIQFSAPDNRIQYIVRPSGSIIHDQAGAAIGRVWVLHDTTAQRKAEAEKDELEGWVRHSQKLETLGVMAGGIAHDFNNLLMVVQGNAEMAQMKAEHGETIGGELQKIVKVTERAAELTGQMLTFAGKGQSAQVPVDFNSLCYEIGELLKAAISKKANFKMELADHIPLVIADRSQLTQIIMNLVTNASDSLGDAAGLITLKTGYMQEDKISGEQAGQGYVTLEVADTGSGMDKNTRDRMFDPFYTTKFTGRGLGLANVMGIVQSHDGRIKVESRAGHGTSITVALPSGISPMPRDKRHASPLEWHGSGVALLADDEPELRHVAAGMLRRAGFEVLEALHGGEAVSLYRGHKKEIDLILLDITMPVMDGREALHEIRAISKNVPVILMSGYTKEDVDISADECTWFLNKPFRFSALSDSLHCAIPD